MKLNIQYYDSNEHREPIIILNKLENNEYKLKKFNILANEIDAKLAINETILNKLFVFGAEKGIVDEVEYIQVGFRRAILLLIQYKCDVDRDVFNKKIIKCYSKKDQLKFLNSTKKTHLNSQHCILKEYNDKWIDIIDEKLYKINKHMKKKQNIFLDKKNLLDKFIWKKKKTDLLFLIQELIRLGYIADVHKINILISNHFTIEGSEWKPDQIAGLKTKLNNKDIGLDPSNEIKKVIEILSLKSDKKMNISAIME